MSERSDRHSWLRALGSEDMPAVISLSDGEYELERTYKHDFFAATGLYCGPSGRVILKIGRVASFFGFPMRWIGRGLMERELAVSRAVDDLPGVPRCLGRWQDTGFVHVYVEGHPLQRHERVGDDFFVRLGRLIEDLHSRNIAYVDLEKRENILVGDDGLPYLIDFQISFFLPAERSRRRGLQRLLGDSWGGFLLAELQAADRYHLLKHFRRHKPDTLTEELFRASYKRSVFLLVHRWVSKPFIMVRRGILKLLTGRSRSEKQDGPAYM